MVNYLISTGSIEDNEECCDYYKYGIEITISSLLNVMLIVSMGLITNHLLDSILFLPMLILTRHFTGGYHARTYFGCNFTCCMTFALILIVQHISLHIDYMNTISVVLGIASIFVVLIKCPVENPNKPIPPQRLNIYKAIAGLLSVVLLIIGVCLINNEYVERYGYLVLFTLFFIATFVIIESK